MLPGSVFLNDLQCPFDGVVSSVFTLYINGLVYDKLEQRKKLYVCLQRDDQLELNVCLMTTDGLSFTGCVVLTNVFESMATGKTSNFQLRDIQPPKRLLIKVALTFCVVSGQNKLVKTQSGNQSLIHDLGSNISRLFEKERHQNHSSLVHNSAPSKTDYFQFTIPRSSAFNPNQTGPLISETVQQISLESLASERQRILGELQYKFKKHEV